MKIEWARGVVARRAVVRAFEASDGIAEDWENFPEVGELDWEEIVKLADHEIKQLDAGDKQYAIAYKFLESRAEKYS
jgi:hypothetical protein